MSDQNEAKTRTIGYLPLEKVQGLNGWDEYLDKSNKLSTVRAETQKAKNSVRDVLKQRLKRGISTLSLRATVSGCFRSFANSKDGECGL